MPFTLRNIKEDLEDVGSRFDGAPDLEFRLATEALELEKSGLSYQRVPPGYRFPYGHTHKKQEEVYVVVRGSGRMKVDDEIVELKEWDAVRVRRVRGEATRPGRRASSSSSSARPISARLAAKTSTASATGGLTSEQRAVRKPFWLRQCARLTPETGPVRQWGNGKWVGQAPILLRGRQRKPLKHWTPRLLEHQVRVPSVGKEAPHRRTPPCSKRGRKTSITSRRRAGQHQRSKLRLV